MSPEEELVRLKANFDCYFADLEAAAGELKIPVPEPGTDMARLLAANVLLKSRLEAVQKENTNLLMANHDCYAWFEALNMDHQRALRALDELARLGNGARYGSSIGNRIAQEAIASMID